MKYEIDLEDADVNRFVTDLREGLGGDLANRIANDIALQIKEPIPPEPEGDVILWVFGTAYKRPGSMRTFYPFANGPSYMWAALIEECDRTKSARPVIYRREAADR